VQTLLTDELPGAAVLATLQQLRAKSLVLAGDDDFALLAPVRDYALGELSRRGLEESLTARHRDYQATRVRELLRLRETEGARRTLVRLEREADDVLAAVEHALGAPNPQIGFVLGALVALEPLISARGPLPAFTEILSRAISAADAESVRGFVELLSRVLLLRGRLLTTSGRFQQGREDLLRARSLGEQVESDELLGAILLEIGVNHHFQRELAAARACYERALELCRGARQGAVRGRCYGNLGAVLHDEGRLTEAAAHYWKAIRALEEGGEARELGNFLSNLAVLEQELGARADARRHYQQALAYLGELAETRLHAIALGNLGVLEAEDGAWEAALKCHEQALSLLQTQNDAFSEALCRARLGAALAVLRREDEANEQLSHARRMIVEADAPRIAAVRLQRAFLDFARARRALEGGERSEARERLRLAEDVSAEIASELHEGVKLTTLSDDVRAALRLLAPLVRGVRHRLERDAEPPSSPTLVAER
ncbi:MAG TPA: tetratricopeptide repeat protein, partial [Polyangiaceae bacterium]|nr:tetratricopeptide repeat protein [Polyangiaceae bacterium]